MQGEFGEPAVGIGGCQSRDGCALVQRLIAQNEGEFIAQFAFQFLDSPQAFGRVGIKQTPAQAAGGAEVAIAKLTGLFVQSGGRGGGFAENTGSAAPLFEAETAQDIQVIVNRFGRFDKNGIGFIRVTE